MEVKTKPKPALVLAPKSLQQIMQELCGSWQNMLRLNDWKASVKILAKDKFHETGNSAESFVNRVGKTIEIHIARPQDWPHEKYDIEADLVHELLHLHMLHVPKAERTSKRQERYIENENTIECLGEALLKLSRNSKEKRFRLHSTSCKVVE